MRTPVCVQDYVELLDKRTRFVQANYGDGEWACILGHPGQNCNGEHYIQPLQMALIDTLVNPPPGHIWYGSNPGKKLGPSVEEWITNRCLNQRVWVYKEVLSGANANGKLGPLIQAVRRRRTVLVGPKHLRNEDVHKIWNIKAQVSVPTSDAFLAIERTVEQTLEMVWKEKPDLILVCSGMAANPLMFRVARLCAVPTMIDMGATLDPYAGIWSRNAYRKDEFQKKIFQKNLVGLES